MSIYSIIKPAIDKLDAKINYVRASIYGSGSAAWIKTAGTPGPSDGADGDYCTDTVNKIVYKKASGAWSVVSIGGGSGWLKGSGAPSSGTGADGDWYLDQDTGKVYGPKASGAWPAAVSELTAKLAAIDGLTWAANKLIYLTGASTAALADLTSWVLGFLGSADASAARTTLGLGSAAVQADTYFVQSSAVGVSVAPLNSPAFTGTPTAPTASAGTNTTQVASCAFVANALAASEANAVRVAGGCYVLPSAGACVGYFVCDRAYTLPTSLTNSQAWAISTATATTTLTIKKNGGTIGTISFAAGAAAGTFSFATTVTVSSGDVLAVYAPSPADATWIGGFMLKGAFV